MLNKLKARKAQLQNKGGFTLVELIVVLVILAILAALLIPALTGYIDRAKEKSAVAETRQVVMAAQTVLDEAYAKGTTITTFNDDQKDEVKGLADVTGTITSITASDNKISKVEYKPSGDTKTCTYTYTAASGSGSSATDAKSEYKYQ